MIKKPAMPLSVKAAEQEDLFARDWWLSRHEQKVQEIKARSRQVNLVFLGDSITHAWEDKGRQAWQSDYAPLQAINLGFNGDRTENLLWRLQHSPLERLSPKLSVLLIGTNNIGHRKDAAEDIFLGVQAILKLLRSNWPDSKVLLLAIFPRGKRPSNPLRKRVNATNLLLSSLADNQHIYWLDLNSIFLDEKNMIHEQVMQDMLHPNGDQYKRWAKAMQPLINQLLK